MSVITHRAKWVIISHDKIVENGYVTEINGRTVDTGTAGRRPRGKEVDHGEGILMPATVNAHTHLDLSTLGELSHLRNDFLGWIRAVVGKKMGLTDRDVELGLLRGEDELRSSGSALAGDHRSFFVHSESARWPLILPFREYLGGDAAANDLVGDDDGHFSLAAHGPHTTSPLLIRRLKLETARRAQLLSIHAAESFEEKEFICTGRGAWADFLEERGIDYSSWGLPARSPVLFLDGLGVLDDKTLAVHLVQADPEDLEVIADRGVRVCVCPRSNSGLVGDLPDIPGMLKRGICPSLGTDSLASVETLNIMHEMAFVARNFPSLRPEDILAMGTINGARCLNMEKELGSLDPGKRACLLFVPVRASSSVTALQDLIACNFKGNIEVCQ
ncbi:MAG: amidohydrolase family protein [Thermodesulfobacteriota bacterium]|nr:amidohydrolase family protein [Thermodesulfobacteriota bacterium]